MVDIEVHQYGNHNFKLLKQDFQSNLLDSNNGSSFTNNFIDTVFDQISAVPILRIHKSQTESSENQYNLMNR